jgi:hypothetical protein
MPEQVSLYAADGSGAINTSNVLPVGNALIATTDSSFCGQISSGSVATQGTDVTGKNGFLITVTPTSPTMWVFAHGGSKTSGYPIATGVSIPLSVTDLNQIDVCSDTTASGSICWLKL